MEISIYDKPLLSSHDFVSLMQEVDKLFTPPIGNG